MFDSSPDCPAERTRARQTVNRRKDGFTLIEIMAVVLIIGLLSTIVGVQIFSQVDKGRVTATLAQISNLEAILELYRMDNATKINYTFIHHRHEPGQRY